MSLFSFLYKEKTVAPVQGCVLDTKFVEEQNKIQNEIYPFEEISCSCILLPDSTDQQLWVWFTFLEKEI